MLDTQAIFYILDGFQRDIMLYYLVWDLIRCVDYCTQHSVSIPLNDGDIGVPGDGGATQLDAVCSYRFQDDIFI